MPLLQRRSAVLLLLCGLSPVVLAGPTTAIKTSAFTLQGKLYSDTIALDGNTIDFYFEFSLWTTATVGTGSQVEFLAVDPVSVKDGYFSAEVDFARTDPDFKFDETQYYLQVCARISNLTTVPCDTLSERVKITGAPYAGISGYVELGKEQEDDKDTTLWSIRNIGTGGAGKFVVAHPTSLSNALVAECDSFGDACSAVATGAGAGLRSSASGSGNAGVFSILNAGNMSNAIDVNTLGGGAAIHAAAAGGAGILAESASGVGLRATSTSGTALDVVGTSAFSGTANFTASVPFNVTSSTLIPNLNAGLLAGQGGPFYTNASNLISGILPDARLSALIVRTNLSQLFTAAQTFTGITNAVSQPTPALNVSNAGAGGGADISSASISPTLLVTNNGSGRAGEFSGDVHTTGKYTLAFTPGTANRAAPIAYGAYSMSSGLQAHTPNVASITWDAGLTRYLIDIGETYNISDYITTITPVVTGGGAPRVATSSANAGKLVVRIFDLNGNPMQQDFHFVVYKP